MYRHRKFLVPGFLDPQDVDALGASRDHRGRGLVERPHGSIEELREALGLPKPSHTCVAVAYRQVACSPRDSLYAWQDGRHDLRQDLEFGKGCFMVGWRQEEYDQNQKLWLPSGPVGFSRGHRCGGEASSSGNTLPVLQVQYLRLCEHSRLPGYTSYRSYRSPSLQGWDHPNVVGVEVEFEGEAVWIYLGMDVAETVFGVFVNERGNICLKSEGHREREFGKFPPLGDFVYDYYGETRAGVFGFFLEDFSNLSGLRVGAASLANMLHKAAHAGGDWETTDAIKKPGLTKIYKNKLRALGHALFEAKEYRQWAALRTLLRRAPKTVRKVKVSAVVNHEFAEIETLEELQAKLQVFLDKGIEGFDYFSVKRKETLKKDTAKAFRKRVAELDEVEIDRAKYPLTYDALTDGGIPLTCIFPAGETYFLINDNWDLWEEMLSKFPEETKEIAKNAGARRMYERDVMSYFYFVLYALPQYLERHTGHSWSCSPRLVESQYELEPEAVQEDRNVIKRRSALTPVADNEKRHVVVPYCSMAVHGRTTTYAYAHSYHLLERGMVFDGNVVTRELEEKLNGKDDYGLMFYTLTGSYTNRGYPTFLVIFERLKNKKKTRVHFHRVHPMRSKEGDRNPVSNWIRVSYKWMIGNVSSEDVRFQQGDLAFVKLSGQKADNIDFSQAVEVTDCDSHCFTKPVKFVKYEGKKKHVLGHVEIKEAGLRLRHPEHDNVSAHVGVFEVRQCRSWEANPKGIWTLNFD